MNQGTVREVMDIIANGYGSVPSGLDRAIASRVVNYFYKAGWMNASDIAILVNAAGGEIRVNLDEVDESLLLVWYDDQATGERVFRTREPVEFVDVVSPEEAEDLVANAKVNPDAESRVVDSGPIKGSHVRGAEGYINANPGPHS